MRDERREESASESDSQSESQCPSESLSTSQSESKSQSEHVSTRGIGKLATHKRSVEMQQSPAQSVESHQICVQVTLRCTLRLNR